MHRMTISCHAIDFGGQSDYGEGGANVQVTNNAKCFLLQKANLPICIHNGRSYYRAPAKKCAVGSPMNPHYGDLV